jgi:hypothetical protein
MQNKKSYHFNCSRFCWMIEFPSGRQFFLSSRCSFCCWINLLVCWLLFIIYYIIYSSYTYVALCERGRETVYLRSPHSGMENLFLDRKMAIGNWIIDICLPLCLHLTVPYHKTWHRRQIQIWPIYVQTSDVVTQNLSLCIYSYFHKNATWVWKAFFSAIFQTHKNQ